MKTIEVKPLQPAGLPLDQQKNIPIEVIPKPPVEIEENQIPDDECKPIYRDVDQEFVDIEAREYARNLDGFAEYLRDKEWEKNYGA